MSSSDDLYAGYRVKGESTTAARHLRQQVDGDRDHLRPGNHHVVDLPAKSKTL